MSKPATSTFHRLLNMKGNALCKSKHYRKLAVSKNHGLLSLDKRDICSEERRRCAAWGCVVGGGGSFDDADAAGRHVLEEIKTKRMKANAEKRSEISSVPSSRNWPGSRAIGRIKVTIGGSREVEHLRKVVEDQRLEINRLKDQVTESGPTTGPIEGGEHRDELCDIDSADSEQDCGYSLEDNQRIAARANAKLAALLVRDTSQVDLSRDVSLQSAGIENIDTFILRPPLPPKN